jgi:hypothetical protein
MRRDAARSYGSNLFCWIACLQKQNAGEFRNRMGEGLLHRPALGFRCLSGCL